MDNKKEFMLVYVDSFSGSEEVLYRGAEYQCRDEKHLRTRNLSAKTKKCFQIIKVRPTRTSTTSTAKKIFAGILGTLFVGGGLLKLT
jgi:hypothetical protein